jgi:4-deoxy-L-threo-5-hexosulose-uronate ketol-isomerase
MEIRYSTDPEHFKRMSSDELNRNFLINSLFKPGEIILTYSDIDRMIIGSVVPLERQLKLIASKELITDYFAQRREIGIVNIGSNGMVIVDGKEYSVANKDVLYIGRGSKEIIFSSRNSKSPALFYITSFPAHANCPTTLLKKADAVILDYGSEAEANKRKIHCYFTEKGIQSCQLTIGITELAPGCVWNTMPAHLHPTRAEAYLYFDMEDDSIVFHFMGRPDETRHVVARNGQAVLSPSWSIHCGVGTRNYSFVWAMGGENKETLTIDSVKMDEIK